MMCLDVEDALTDNAEVSVVHSFRCMKMAIGEATGLAQIVVGARARVGRQASIFLVVVQGMVVHLGKISSSFVLFINVVLDCLVAFFSWWTVDFWVADTIFYTAKFLMDDLIYLW